MMKIGIQCRCMNVCPEGSATCSKCGTTLVIGKSARVVLSENGTDWKYYSNDINELTKRFEIEGHVEKEVDPFADDPDDPYTDAPEPVKKTPKRPEVKKPAGKPVNKPVAKAEEKTVDKEVDSTGVISIGQWVITFILLTIPLVNIGYIIKTLVDKKENKTKKNYMIAYLILMAVSLILGIVVSTVIVSSLTF